MSFKLTFVSLVEEKNNTVAAMCLVEAVIFYLGLHVDD